MQIETLQAFLFIYMSRASVSLHNPTVFIGTCNLQVVKMSVSENEQSFILFGVDNYGFWMKNSCFSKPMLTMTQMLLLNCKSCASICSQFSLWMCKKMETLLWNGIRFNWGLSYPLLVILFLSVTAEIRSWELLFTNSHFSSCSMASVPFLLCLNNVFITTSN